MVSLFHYSGSSRVLFYLQCQNFGFQVRTSLVTAEGKKFEVLVSSNASVKALYEEVGHQLEVDPEYLKIIFKGKSLMFSDDTLLTDMKVTDGAKMMALGRKVCKDECGMRCGHLEQSSSHTCCMLL